MRTLGYEAGGDESRVRPPNSADAIRGQRLTVMGVGAHDGGVGTTRYLARHGAIVTLTDLAPGPMMRRQLGEVTGVRRALVLGKHRGVDFVDADWVVRSAAILDTNPFVRLARANAVPVVLDLDFFLRWCPTKNIVAVTGTKGKSTTSTMIARVLRAGGKFTVLAGNIGASPFNDLDQLTEDSWVVLELSSVQLAMLTEGALRPRIAVLTNLYEAHLGEHGSFDRYTSAKLRVFENQLAGDQRLVSDDVPAALTRRVGQSTRYGARDVPPAWAIGVPGEHNRTNAAAALHIAGVAGIPLDLVAESLRTFEPLPGRMRLTATIDGVRYYNDRLAGVAEATASAIRSMPGPTILLIGGLASRFNAETIRAAGRGRLKAVIQTPSSPDLDLVPVFPGIPIHKAESLLAATEIARRIATPGDCVLYSPPFSTYPIPRLGYIVGRSNVDDRAREFDDAVATLESRNPEIPAQSPP